MDEKKKVTIRIDDNLYKQVKKSAIDANQAIGTHIEYLLFKALQPIK